MRKERKVLQNVTHDTLGDRNIHLNSRVEPYALAHGYAAELWRSESGDTVE
jgi:hypothetical protein